jgi:two-component system, NarL family, nitrate/nitrite response regulator NarL
MPPKRIIVADDSDIYRDTLCEFVQRFPNVELVGAATDGLETVQLIEDTQPDILLLDIRMPHMDGWEVLEHLRSANTAIHIIIISAHNDLLYQKLAIEKGADSFVPKGNLRLLTQSLQSLLEDTQE